MLVTFIIVITTFRDKRTAAIFNGKSVKGVDAKLIKKARMRLQYLHAAIMLEDLYFPPSNKLHALQGFTPTRYAIAVDKQWRITFEWRDHNAFEVCFEDYH